MKRREAKTKDIRVHHIFLRMKIHANSGFFALIFCLTVHFICANVQGKGNVAANILDFFFF